MKLVRISLEFLHIGLRSAVVGAAHATQAIETPTALGL